MFGHDDRAVFGTEPRQRLIKTQFALRQADDRLEIEIDPVLFERSADHLQQHRIGDAFEIGGGLSRRHRSGRCGRIIALRLFRQIGGEIAHQAFQHLQFRNDLAALFAGAGFDQFIQIVEAGAAFLRRAQESAIGRFQGGEFLRGLAALTRARKRAANLGRSQQHHHGRNEGERDGRPQRKREPARDDGAGEGKPRSQNGIVHE